MTCRIRKMIPEDLPWVMEILDRWSMGPTPAIANAERSGIEIEHTFIAEDEDGRLVGVGSYLLHGGEVAETASLAVSPRSAGGRCRGPAADCPPGGDAGAGCPPGAYGSRQAGNHRLVQA